MPKGRLERAASAADELERTCDWLGAAECYKKAVDFVSATDSLRQGELQEKIGHCFYRAAFQTDDPTELKERMQRALDSYARARGFYVKLADAQKAARVYRCDAVASYLGFWLTSDPSEQRRRLDECLEREANALQAFSEAGDMLEYGRTYGALPLVFWLRVELEWSGQVRERICGRGMEWGEKAVAALSEVDAFHELAKAYYTLSTCLFWMVGFIAEPEKQEEILLKITEYLHKAVDLAERTNNGLFVGLSGIWLASLIGQEEQRKTVDEALRCGEKTRDNRLIACSLSFQAELAFQTAYVGEDPVKVKELMDETFQFYDRAHRLYSSTPIPYAAGMMGFPYGWVSYYGLMAERESVLEKRLGFLKKAEEAGAEALRLAESSDSPDRTELALATLAWVQGMRAQTDSDPTVKRRRLEMALESKERVCQIREETGPFNFWNRGVGLTTLARTKMYLADVEPDPAVEQRLLEEASLSMENGLKMCDIWVPFGEKTGQTIFIAVPRRDQDCYATLLTRLYCLTNKPEHLRRAIEMSQKAIDSSSKLDLVSRMAESYWKIATAQDLLGDHPAAAENFNMASNNYTSAAERIPQFTDFYSDYALYMSAWADLERSRHERKHENHAKSREHYHRCSRRLERTKKWSYLSSYYFAWSLLERGEALSRLDKPHHSLKAFSEAGRTFGDSAKSLRRKAEQLKPSEEREEAVKLANMAGLRQQYCMGRVLMEEAQLSSRKGDRLAGAEKYAAAARIFEDVAPNLEREDARGELQFAAAICDARGQMQRAEDRGDAALYQKAAELFVNASRISRRKTAELTAMGNSCYCEGLALGMKFLATSNQKFYSGAKTRMENAAGYYQRAGVETPALWVEATKRLFDAYVYAGRAEAEPEPETRVRFYLMAEKCLVLAAESFGKAGHRGKQNEVLQSLERVRKERTLALSLSEVLSAPTLLSSATGVVMPDLTEQAVGLNDFESVNIRARVSVPEEFVPGEELQLKLDVVNVGKEPGLLVRIEGLVPAGCEVLRVPSQCTLEGASLNMQGRMLGPLAVESVTIAVQIADIVDVRLSPRVVYVDEQGQFRTLRVEATRIRPVIEFATQAAQAVFTYLVNAFVEDRVKRKLGVETSGWRSCPQIIKGAGVSKRSLYGPGGRLGHGVSELQRKGLVDVETRRGERGRGGHILRVRIHHEKAAVRRYVNEKAPDLLT